MPPLLVFLTTEIREAGELALFGVARSGRPSPSRSIITTPLGWRFVVTSVAIAKEPVVNGGSPPAKVVIKGLGDQAVK